MGVESDKELLKSQIKADVESINRQFPKAYDPETLKLVTDHSSQLLELYDEWNKALVDASKSLKLDSDEPTQIPALLEKWSNNNEIKKSSGVVSKIILGFAGPGASGKGTISEMIGAPRIIATTTRERRDYEVDGVHYRFVTLDEFKRQEKSELLIAPTFKPQRGWYGLHKDDLAKSVKENPINIIEESPENLIRIGAHIKEVDPNISYYIVYILPPGPVLPTLALRLAKRSAVSGKPYVEDIASTLGLRQVNEFRSVVEAATSGVNILFIINDEVEKAVSAIRELIV